MPTWDIIATVQNVISLILEGSQLAFFIWLATGGIVWLVRQVGFWLDVQLVNQIAKFYEYFSKILDGTLFNDEVINAVMRNVYIFIGVILFFRLVMVLLKYIVNPELVDDGKKGAQQLIKRVIIGMMGILFIPILFTTINDFQAAFLKDQVLQKVLIPEDILEETQKKAQNAGKYIGTYVLAGFFNPSEKASEASKNEYKQALKKGDMALLISNANKGGWFVAGYANTYEYSYFPILSTFVIGYVLFLVIKYCLDLVTRMLKLFLYRLLSPIAMIEYMINGADDGVFKNWKTAVISTYCMLFVRVFAMWFVVFVMTLMSGELPGDKYTNGTLLAENDYLLRAIIMVALLAFMMDLPKIIGQVFGVDLEQEGSATGLLNTIKGGAMAIVGAGAAIGGAALGGLAGAAKGGMGSLNSVTSKGMKNKADALEKGGNKAKAEALRKKAAALDNRVNKLGTFKTTGLNSLKAAAGGALEGAAGASNLTKTAYGSYKAVGSSVKNKADQKKAEDEQAARARIEQERHEELRGELKDKNLMDTARMVNESVGAETDINEKITKTAEVRIKPKMAKVDGIEADVNGVKLKGTAAVQAQVDSVMGQPKMSDEVKISTVANVVSSTMGQHLDVPAQEVESIVRTVYQDSGVPQGDKAETIVRQVETRAMDVAKEEVAPYVEAVSNHRIMTTIETHHKDIHDEVHNVSENINKVNKTVEKVDKDINTNFQTTNNIITEVHEDINQNFTTTNEVIEDRSKSLANSLGYQSRKTRDKIEEQTDRLLRPEDNE